MDLARYDCFLCSSGAERTSALATTEQPPALTPDECSATFPITRTRAAGAKVSCIA